MTPKERCQALIKFLSEAWQEGYDAAGTNEEQLKSLLEDWMKWAGKAGYFSDQSS